MLIDTSTTLQILPILLAVLALWRTYRRDAQGEFRAFRAQILAEQQAFETRLRRVEDALIKLEEWQRSRAMVPERLSALEQNQARANDLMELLRHHLPHMLLDAARLEHR